MSDEEAAELASRPRAGRDPAGAGVAERLERGLLAGIAIVGTSRPEAEAVLGVIDEWTPERLREVADSLREFLARMAHDQRGACQPAQTLTDHAGKGKGAVPQQGGNGSSRDRDATGRLHRVFHARAVFS